MDISDFIGDLVDRIKENIIIRDGIEFNLREVVEDIFTTLDTAAGNAFSFGNAETATCISRVLQENTNTELVSSIIDDIGQIRMAVTSISRMFSFYDTFNRTLAGFRLGEQCLTGFIERYLCARCTQNVPPLCSNVCGGIVRGCFSPVFNGLQAQFNIMWRVGRQLVDRINSILDTLYTQEDGVIDIAATVS